MHAFKQLSCPHAVVWQKTPDAAEIHASVPTCHFPDNRTSCYLLFAAIARRVSIVVLVGVALGVGLFFLGLEYMFPKI
jgi:hypothetical protein